ncbi:flagellar hook-length control protein FliK [Congregibacter litoralis]|uniref:Flagellar hook-length control protein n=1 Tax=Congregibacter litoralis KT71 TaxID=314285 RepID=A4A5Z1_9GAMM|nr:flagellar hook-length control protein FliK [Congregibacter litoralis]EAQ98438.1 Flagellar hook-length control protein [Congregibacter litoralis KT71]
MADRVNSPLLTVAPTETAGVKAAKVGNYQAKSGENSAFSKVLDGQRSRDAQSEKSTDGQAGAEKAAGKALPQEGKDTAESTAREAASTQATEATAATVKPDPRSEGGVASMEAGSKADTTAVSSSAPRETTPAPMAFSASLSPLAPGESAAGLTPSDAQPITVPAGSTAVGEWPLPGQGDAKTPGDVSLKTAEPSAVNGLVTASTQAAAAGKGGELLSASGTSAPPVSLSQGSPELSSAASALVSAAETVKSGANPNSNSPVVTPGATTAAVNGSVAATAETAASATAGFVSKPLTGAEAADPNRSPSPGDALAMDTRRAVTAQASGPTSVTDVLNRSTVDWLRSGMGSEHTGQRSVAEMQGATLSDISGGAVSTPRGEGLTPTGATPATAVLSPSVGATPPSATPATAAVPEYSLTRAPDDGEFPGELTARMKTLVRDGVREARLQLHPAELGRLQVTVTTEGDQTKVVFTAETLAARDAIEQSMPRLREMLEQSGLQLAQSDVGQGDLGRGSESGERGEGKSSADEAAVADAADSDDSRSLIYDAGKARIDTYI